MHRLGNAPEPALRHRPTPAHDLLSPYADILTFWDIVAGILAGYVTFSIYLQYWNLSQPVTYIAGPFVREVILGTCLAAILLQERQVAEDHQVSLPYQLLVHFLWRACAVSAALLSVPALTRAFGDRTDVLIITWCAVFCSVICASRGIFVVYLYQLARRGALCEAVAVVGAPDVAGRLAAQLAENVAIVGVFDEMENADDNGSPSCAMTELLELARSGAVDTVVVALHPTTAPDAATIVRHLQSVPIQITVCSDVSAPAAPRRKRRRVGNVSMDVVADRPLRRRDLVTKSIIDKVVAALFLIALSPFLLVIAMAIAWDSPGPVIFRQRRSGWGGVSFTIFKLRTMRHEPHAVSMYQTARNDPRCTRIGRFLRRTSLDELPQLWNVLRGDMSLVGPRPHAEMLHKDNQIACTIVANYAQRHRVKPGLTGWAQINGSRGAIRTPEALRRRIAYDLYYIEHWSVWLDLKILAATPLAMLTGENAY
jgi:Undecaprenyl-phosphate glucose phosphotransferase